MGKKRRCVNYMEIYILSDAIIVMWYKNILASGWKCYWAETPLNVLNVSGNVPLPFPQGLILGSMREANGKRPLKIGTLLPNIVLYNDPTPHPSTTTTTTVISADLARKPDLLLIFGTSLKVHGIKKLVRDFAKQVHANKGTVILINKCELGKAEWSKFIDYWVEGDCDEWIHDLKSRIPNLWMKQEVMPVMPVIKPTPKKNGTFPCSGGILFVVANGAKTDDDNKENYVLTTPRKSPRGAGKCQIAKAATSPLSPSKRAINVDALESPTKRLQLSRLQISCQDDENMPPKMNWAIAGKGSR